MTLDELTYPFLKFQQEIKQGLWTWHKIEGDRKCSSLLKVGKPQFGPCKLPFHIRIILYKYSTWIQNYQVLVTPHGQREEAKSTKGPGLPRLRTPWYTEAMFLLKSALDSTRLPGQLPSKLTSVYKHHARHQVVFLNSEEPHERVFFTQSLIHSEYFCSTNSLNHH